MIKIALFALVLSIVAFTFSPSLTLAQQGCCSIRDADHDGIPCENLCR